MNNDDTERMLKSINQNKIYYNIGMYIIRKFNLNVDIEYAKTWGKYLISTKGYSEKMIYNGAADDEIKKIIKKYQMKCRSVKEQIPRQEMSQNKNEKAPNLSTRVEKKEKSKVIRIIAGILVISSLGTYGVKKAVDKIDELNKFDEVSSTLGIMASANEENEYESTQDIVEQNTYHAGIDREGFATFAYDNSEVAKDIIKVCIKEPELFDLCLNNVYLNIKYDRLQNMDEIINYLKAFTKDEESLSFIEEKLSDCDVFIDYVVKMGFANPNNEDYNKLFEDINTYKNIGKEKPFNYLDEEAQKRIKNLLNEYAKNQKILYNENVNILKKEEAEYGTRS